MNGDAAFNKLWLYFCGDNIHGMQFYTYTNGTQPTILICEFVRKRNWMEHIISSAAVWAYELYIYTYIYIHIYILIYRI